MRWYTFILLLVSTPLLAQQERCQWFTEFDREFRADSLTIVPGSFSLSVPAGVDYDINRNTIRIRPEGKVDSIRVCYTVFPLLLNRKVSHRSPGDSIQFDNSAVSESPSRSSNKLGNKYIKSGILSRGVNLGNRQDMSVDSRMDLRIEGKITDDLRLKAHIFDQNIPYQPEGNTNSLKNFNRLYINVYNENLSVEAGDIQLENDGYSFHRFRRGLMGTGFQWKDSIHRVNIQTGMNKGRFHSFVFNGEEGLNGPYKISGPVSDPFIIILAASEQVYLDGRKMNRGEDYEIDYNLGEISFLPTIVITRFSRVRIDFEYMNQSFQRSARTVDYRYRGLNTEVYLGYFREKDNTHFNNTLTNEELELISGSQEWFKEAPSFVEVPFSTEKVSYVMTDSLGFENILVFSRDATQLHYSVKFTYVGPNQGDYVRDYGNYNEPLFKWVAPIDGKPGGDYSPYKRINAPTSLELLTLGATSKLTTHESAFSELTYSSFNSNTLGNISPLRGLAIKAGLKTEGRLLGPQKKYRFSADLGTEWIDDKFRQADPFRPVDFDRDWSVTQIGENVEETRVFAGFNVSDLASNHVSWRGNLRNRGDIINGWNSLFDLKYRGKVWLENQFYRMENKNSTGDADWNRVRIDISIPTLVGRPGYSYRSEKNTVMDPVGKSLVSSLQYFDEHSWYLNSNEDKDSNFRVSYTLRDDKVPLHGDWDEKLRSETLSSKYRRKFSKGFIDLVLSHRTLKEGNNQVSESLMGGTTSNFSLFDGAIKTNLNLSTQNGWEPRREYVYREVPSGQGFYTWRDLNDDGIQQLDEFFEAINPDEMNYTRFFVTTPERIIATENRLNMVFNIRWPAKTANDILKKLKSTIRWDLRGKSMGDKFRTRFSSVMNPLDHNEVLSGLRRLKYRLFANDLFEFLSFDMGYSNNGRKNWVLDGHELRIGERIEANTVFKLSSVLSWKIGSLREVRKNSSDVLNSRNYSFIKSTYSTGWELRPTLRWSVKSAYRFKVGKGGTSEENIDAELHELNLESQWRLGKSRDLILKSEYAHIEYKGNPNSALAYDMLEAFHPGNNFRVTLNVRQELNSGLMIHMIYMGRTSSSQWINRASVRLTARF